MATAVRAEAAHFDPYLVAEFDPYGGGTDEAPEEEDGCIEIPDEDEECEDELGQAEADDSDAVKRFNV
ncbi:unnamed protein product [Symbiodinium natans]|uniref:Uncharacterized protein n=1 Tax=Symbiodinium natans TaxID=878477 RepID=A0A812II02_9DINO|nr:unnamed protein product [Symbiodinium natans]